MTGLRFDIPHYIGERIINGKLCLINQKRNEAWVYNNSSIDVWKMLKKRQIPEALPREVMSKFMESLYERGLVKLRSPSSKLKKHNDLIAHNKTIKLGYEAYKSHTIYNAMIELTYHCNLRCVHCYLSSLPKDILTFLEVKDILDQLVDHGCPQVFFTGGEIFLRKDMLDIVRYSQSKGFLVTLFTNGTLISSEIAEELSKAYIAGVKISLYGSTAKSHESVTKVKGSFNKTISNIKLLRRHNIPVDIGLMALSHNTKELLEIDKFCSELDVQFNIDMKIFPKQDNSREPLKFAASDDDLRLLFETSTLRPFQETICLAGQVKIKIDPQGYVFPCEYWRHPIGTIREKPLDEIWNSQKLQEIVQRIKSYNPSACLNCALREHCFKCPAFVDLDSDTAPAQYCNWTRLYAESQRRNKTDLKLAKNLN